MAYSLKPTGLVTILLDNPAARIERIGNRRTSAVPEVVLYMAKAYNDSRFCSYDCFKKCLIKHEYSPAVEIKGSEYITPEALSALNLLNQMKDRFIEIAADGKITGDEYEDF